MQNWPYRVLFTIMFVPWLWNEPPITHGLKLNHSLYFITDLLLTARRRENSAAPKNATEKNSDQEQEKDNKAWRRYPWQYWNYWSSIICVYNAGYGMYQLLLFFWGSHALYRCWIYLIWILGCFRPKCKVLKTNFGYMYMYILDSGLWKDGCKGRLEAATIPEIWSGNVIFWTREHRVSVVTMLHVLNSISYCARARHRQESDREHPSDQSWRQSGSSQWRNANWKWKQ